jgi:hypothetical protein
MGQRFKKFRNIKFDWDIEDQKVSAMMIFPSVEYRELDKDRVSSTSIIRDAYKKFLGGTEIKHVQSNQGTFNLFTLTLSFAKGRHDHEMTVEHFNKLVMVIYDQIDFHIDRAINSK